MKVRIVTRSIKMTASATPGQCAVKKMGDHRKLSAICAHHSVIALALRSRSQVRQPAIATSR
jgi:hypothetical protein